MQYVLDSGKSLCVYCKIALKIVSMCLCLTMWCVLLACRTSLLHILLDISTRNRVTVCLGRLSTYRDVSPELGHIIVIGAEELGEPADGPLTAFVHCFVSLKVLIVFVH